jgi:hypothetical protein
MLASDDEGLFLFAVEQFDTMAPAIPGKLLRRPSDTNNHPGADLPA